MTTVYSAKEVAKHNTKNDCWMSIHGKVYNVTPYMEDHPGGVDSLVEVAGQDATVAFEDLGHSADARERMERYLIGTLDPADFIMAKKVARQLPPDTTWEAPATTLTGLAMRVLADVVSMCAVLAVAFASMRRFGHYTTSHNWPVPTSVVDLLPWAVTTSLLSRFVRRTFRKLVPPEAEHRRPHHFKVPHVVAPQQAPNHAVLDPRQYTDFPITAVEKLSENSNKIVVELPTPTSVLGLPVGQHVSIRAMIDGASISRSYTPTSSNKDLGRLELVIKNYDSGLLTGRYLKDVKVGDKLSVSGPRGQMRYRRGLAKNIGMIAGGTGITPMYQVIRAVCEDKRDTTKIVLLYANQTEADILLKAELDNLVSEHGDQLTVKYLLSRPGPNWSGGVGRVNQQLAQQSFALADDRENKVMLCGPQGMVDDAKEWLAQLGYEHAHAVSKMADQVFVF